MKIVFDAYGTLWNVSQIEHLCGVVVGERDAHPLLDLWRRKQLEYAFLRTIMDRYASFERITTDALQFALESLRLEVNSDASRDLIQAWYQPEAYHDAVPMLQSLKGHERAILSNGDPVMLSRGVEVSTLGEHLEAVLSVASSKRYKPHRDAYQVACNYWKVDAQHIVFVSSNGWDVAGASHFGFRTIWVNRSGLPQEGLGARLLAVVSSLAEIPVALRQAGLD